MSANFLAEKMATVSVVIPTFNRNEFIEKCVISVLQQSKKANEIIVVDDGSNDRTWSTLKKLGFSESDKEKKSLRYIFQSNRGVSAARNIGIKASKYKYIAFLDSDDSWLESKLEKQIKSLENLKPQLRLSHTNEIWVRNGERVNARHKHEKSGGDIFLKCLKLCCISPSSSVVERSVFDEFGLFDESLPACEDYDFWLRFCAYEKVHFIDEPLLVKNGGHNGQLSKMHWGMDRFRAFSLEKLLLDKNLSEFKRYEIVKELIYKLEILIKGGLKRNKGAFVKKLYDKKTELEAIL